VPKHSPSLATRAAALATATAAASVLALLPAGTAAATPAAPAPAAPAPAAPATVPVAPAVQTLAAARTAAAPAAARASAVQHALGKIGAPYRWGGAGPAAFDCSGLVSWAFTQAGVPLPRTSRAMSRVGTPVSRANLRPGDLVFFYSPVSHVAIYVGNGKVVHASTSSKPVNVANVSSMPFNSARRV
jgi:cell wall-associated NlpC family hydrolase